MSIEEARAEVAEWEGHHETWLGRLTEQTQKLNDLEANLGEAVIEADDPKAVAKLTEQRSLVEACESAIRSCAKKIGEAQRAVKACEAEDLEARAAELRAEADRHCETTDGLLAKLQEHEGCPYLPKPRPTPLEVDMAGAAGVVWQQPYSERLRDEALGLENQAAAIREQLNAESEAERQERERRANEEFVRHQRKRYAEDQLREVRERGGTEVQFVPGGEIVSTEQDELTPGQVAEIDAWEASLQSG